MDKDKSKQQQPNPGEEVGSKTVTLPSGKIAVIKAFKGKTVMRAQAMAGIDTEKHMGYMISLTTEIDGKQIVIEDLEEMDGWDYMHLMGEFTSASFTSPVK